MACAEGRVSAYRWSRHPLRCRRPFGRPPARPPVVVAWPRRYSVGAVFTANPAGRPAVPATALTFVISSRATLEPRGTAPAFAAVSRCASGATRRRNTFANGVLRLCRYYLLIRVRSYYNFIKEFFFSKVRKFRHANNIIIIIILIVIIMTSGSFWPRNTPYAITFDLHQ